ncbi:class II myosin [Coemansia sp. RSA 376]|nr:class II myosin [Coemansia sp. RSA 376]
MDFLKPVFEGGRIDFAGQRLASNLSSALVVGSAVVALFAGLATQRLSLCFYTYVCGIVLTYAVVLLPWPPYNRSPVIWLSRKAPAASNDSVSQSLKTLQHRPSLMNRTTRQGPTVASIRRAIQQGLDRPESPVPAASLSSRTAPVVPDLFEQANVNFTDKKWVWVAHEKEGYIAGYVVKDDGADNVVVHLMTGRDISVNLNDTDKVNPPKFEKADDMADLGYLNEASVVHNLKQRYASNMIYTYSGLFLVAVNPYYNLQIYGQDYVAAYRNKKRNEVSPHIFAIADAAFHDMLHSKENQSILITGESGAGKTENTKKVIQYLTAIAGDHKAASGAAAVSGSSLEQQVLSANPILESFGNAQTIRNNNSSRFGKFIRIEFNFAGQIAGANIEWYLLEKPRVTNQSKQERNYHIFYQFMKGADKSIKDKLLIDKGPEGYTFTQRCRQTIQGVDDAAEFEMLVKAMTTTGFRAEEQADLFRIIAAILHLGNVQFQATRNDEAVLREQVAAEKLCHVLGIQLSDFTRALLRPSIKAGKDWVTQSRTLQQVTFSVEALARSMYERMFGALVSRINSAMSRPDGKSTFIGVLDIAGFEILETNSFEQLCINYTNERLQQFFNRTMFVLEQEEYKREGIEWNFIDFGMDLQPTIELIDRTKPIGIMSCLDEECVMPKATDKTFTEKLHGLWAGKSDKYDVPRFALGFIVKHYASQVEYSTEGWLEKNKDPLNENVTRLLGNSSEGFVAQLYADYADSDSGASETTLGGGQSSSGGGRSRVVTTLKRGAFRTVGQRHKDQLNMLMAQLHSTQPHFVRCILPNSEKRAGKIDTPLVLDQLRCNGVLEGIRITRQGFPNRVAFPEFRQRYEILAPNTIPRQVFVDSKQAASLLLDALRMDKAKYRLGHTKVFFRAGVLAELEEIRDVELSKIITQFQAVARGALSRSRFRRRIEQARAIRVIQRNARVYNELSEWPWWKLYRTVKPLLHVTRVDEEMRKREARIAELEAKVRAEEDERRRLETGRHDLERAKSDIEALLISERSAALDQEEILKRTQEREVELAERLRDQEAKADDLEEQASAEVEHARAEAEQARADLKQARADLELAKANLEQHQQHNDALSGASAEAAEYRVALERIEADHGLALERIGELETFLRTAQELQARLDENEAMRDEYQLRITTQSQEYEELKGEHEELKAKHQQRSAAQSQLEKANAEAVAERDDLRGAYHDLEAQLQDARVAAEREGAHALELEHANAEFKAQHDALTAHAAELKAQAAQAQAEAADLQARLEEASASHGMAQEVKARGEAQHKEIQDKLLREVAAKEAQAEDARRQLLQEVADLGKRLDAEASEREKADRARAAADAELQRLRLAADSASRGRDDADAARRDASARLLQAEADAEALRRAVDDYKALADRHERKAGAQLETITARDLELTQLGRKLQRVERRLEEVMAQAAYHLDARNRLDSENVELREKLDDAYRQQGSADDLSRGLSNAADSSALVRRAEAQAAERVHAAEESRLALTQALQAAQREVEDKQHELVDLDRSFGSLQDELEAARSALLGAERDRDDARDALSGLRAQLAAERSLRGSNEGQAAELSDRLDAMRETLATYEASMRDAADERQHADNVAASARAEARDALDALADAVRARDAAEAARLALESRVLDLQARLDDSALAVDELEHVRAALQRELGAVSDRHRGDVDDQDRAIDGMRATYQKELEDTTRELEATKKDHIDLREAYISLDSSLALKTQELDRANEDAADAKKELMRVMAKLEEIAPAYERARDAAKALEARMETAKHERDSAVAKAAEAKALYDEMRSVKEKLETRLDEVQNKYIEASQGRQTAEKAALQLEDKVRSARARLEEINDDQSSAEERVARLDAVVADAHLALDKEREANTILTKDKNVLERQLKEMKLRIVNLETEALAHHVKGTKRFQPIVPADLSAQIEAQAKASLEHQQKAKQMERQIRELQFQIGEKDKSKQRADVDLQRMSGRIKRLEDHVKELEFTGEKLTSAKHRLERELGALRSRNASPAFS